MLFDLSTSAGLFRVVVVIAYIYVLFTYIDEKDIMSMVLLTGITSLLICRSDSLFRKVSGYRNSGSLFEGLDDKEEEEEEEEEEPFSNIKEGMGCKKRGGEGFANIDGSDGPLNNFGTSLDDVSSNSVSGDANVVANDANDAANVVANVDDIVEGLDEKELKDTNISQEMGKLFRKDVPFNNMSPYDGLCLKTGNADSWLKSPSETALVPDNQLFSFLASQGPLKPSYTDNSGLSGPPVDGVKGSPQKLFMLANNRSSPECCPSTFSTSTGCVCTTKNQRDYLSTRGINDA